MAILQHQISNDRTLLRTRTLLGRAPACDVRMNNRLVSGEHATIWWSEGTWWVRDLGSRNGTRLDDRRLKVGVAERLDAGCLLRFGDQVFVLESASPPKMGAIALDDGEIVSASGALMAIPSDDDPVAMLYQGPNGGFQLDMADIVCPVENLEVIEVAGRLWRVELPLSMDSTLEVEELPASVLTSNFCFTVSLDEEHVQLTLTTPVGGEVVLPDRVHMYALVVLARVRLADAQLSPSEQGWVDRVQLCRMLAMDRKHLNLQLFRARKQLSDAGFEDMGELVQRRGSTLRFGPVNVEVRAAGE
ncbi:MAG: hypothetical protein ACI9MC_000627 [Kiritimatiellia bacterium]|jgi:hypothetical protein